MIDIYKYTNYRSFLKEYYNFLKKENSAFSYRYFSMKCGYKSPNFLKMVIDGQRNLSEESVDKFSTFFKLQKKEKTYFKLLVDFSQTKSVDYKREVSKKIMAHTAFKKLHPLSQDYFEYCSKWYFIAIRELLVIKGVKHDAETISALLYPKVSKKDVEKAFNVLLNLGLIERKNNRFTQVNSLVTTGDEVSSAFISDYHRSMLELASDSIDNISRELRDVSSVVVSISHENISELKSLIQNFRKQVLDLSEQDENKEEVYQVGVQMFPLSAVEVKK